LLASFKLAESPVVSTAMDFGEDGFGWTEHRRGPRYEQILARFVEVTDDEDVYCLDDIVIAKTAISNKATLVTDNLIFEVS
jgi:hypothetical protein